jgi:hypothetical protein
VIIFADMTIKNCLLIALAILCSCGGKLSDEQRKAIREDMEKGEIKRITDAELTEAAYQFGRTIIDELGENKNNEAAIQLIGDKFGVKISTLQSGDSALMEIEKMIIEAYASGNSPELSDNIQKLGTDSLLYTKPVMKTMPDGSMQFEKAIGIHIPKKQVVLSIKE